MAEQTDTTIGGLTDEQIESAVKIICNGGTLRHVKGLSNEEIEALYASGVEYYKAGNYTDARKIFRLLALIEHTSSRFWTAFGSASQALKDYKQAIEAYQMGAFMDMHNPKPAYYAAECFNLTGDRDNALKALGYLLMFAPKDTDLGKTYRAKGEALKARIEAAA